MKSKEFFGMLEESGKDILRSPVVVLPGAAFLLFILGLSTFGGRIAYSLQTTPSNIIWVVSSLIIFLGVGGFVSAGLIGVCREVVGKSKIGKSFF